MVDSEILSVVCIDSLTDSGFQKQWHTLCDAARVVSRGEVESCLAEFDASKALLAVIHRAVLSNEQERVKMWHTVRDGRPNACVLWVGSSMPARTSRDGQVHDAQVPFPNGVSLAPLAAPFLSLLEDLGSALQQPDGANRVHRLGAAWDRWEQSFVPKSALATLIVLCETAIAGHAEVGTDLLPVDQLEAWQDTLDGMGWTTLSRTAPDTVACLRQAAPQPLQALLAPGSWQACLGSQKAFEQALEKDLDGRLPAPVTDLLRAVYASQLDLATVYHAYRALRSRRKGLR